MENPGVKRKKRSANCIEIVPIFSSLSEEEMLEIAKITIQKTFEKGEMIYLSGDKIEKLYVLHSGRVKITRLSTNGKEQVIRIVGPGDFIGELSLFSSTAMTDNAEALENTIMCMIEGSKLKEKMRIYPSIAFKAMEELSNRLEKAEDLIEDINLHTVEQRLAHFLVTQTNNKDEVILKLTKGDLASQIGMSQETLSRKLSSFQEQGYITLSGQKKILIKDKNGLEQML